MLFALQKYIIRNKTNSHCVWIWILAIFLCVNIHDEVLCFLIVIFFFYLLSRIFFIDLCVVGMWYVRWAFNYVPRDLLDRALDVWKYPFHCDVAKWKIGDPSVMYIIDCKCICCAMKLVWSVSWMTENKYEIYFLKNQTTFKSFRSGSGGQGNGDHLP